MIFFVKFLCGNHAVIEQVGLTYHSVVSPKTGKDKFGHIPYIKGRVTVCTEQEFNSANPVQVRTCPIELKIEHGITYDIPLEKMQYAPIFSKEVFVENGEAWSVTL